MQSLGLTDRPEAPNLLKQVPTRKGELLQPSSQKFLWIRGTHSILVGLSLSILGCFALLRRRKSSDLLSPLSPCSEKWLANHTYCSGKIGHSLYDGSSKTN